MKDHQKNKVYLWENKFIPSGRHISFEEIQAYVNNVWSGMGLSFPPKVKVLPSQKHALGDATRLTVRFPKTGATEHIILHELAHAMTADIDGLSHQHNEYFVGMLMTLAEKYLNGNVLFMWVSAEHNGVKYTKFQKPMLHSLYDQAAVAHG